MVNYDTFLVCYAFVSCFCNTWSQGCFLFHNWVLFAVHILVMHDQINSSFIIFLSFPFSTDHAISNELDTNRQDRTLIWKQSLKREATLKMGLISTLCNANHEHSRWFSLSSLLVGWKIRSVSLMDFPGNV